MQSCHIMVIIHTDQCFPKDPTTSLRCSFSFRGETATVPVNVGTSKPFQHPQPTLYSITCLCMCLLFTELSETPFTQTTKRIMKTHHKKKTQTSPNKLHETTFLPNQQKRARKIIHPKKTNPTPTTYHQATY